MPEDKKVTPPAPAAPTRTPNPWVVVSKTARIETVPLALLKAETPERDADGRPRWGGKAVLHLEPGVNFLACVATIFGYENQDPSLAPGSEPVNAEYRAVHLRQGPNSNWLQDFLDRDKKVDVVALEAGLLRALKWMSDPANEKHGGNAYRYVPDRGHDVPDLTLVRIGDLLSARGDDPAKMSRLSVFVGRRTQFSKWLPVIGALHDHAVRHGSIAAHVTEACRARRKAFQPM